MNDNYNGGDWRQFAHPFAQSPKKSADIGSPSVTDRPSEGIMSRASEDSVPTEVSLPKHLFIPAGGQSLDIRVAADVGAGTAVPTLLMSFKCPKGARVQFLGYGVYSDGILAANQEFIPRVKGSRVFPYHGDPNDNFKINLGLGPDLSNNAIIATQLSLESEQVIEWYVTNINIVDIAMGVRMIGYVDRTQTRTAARSGG